MKKQIYLKCGCHCKVLNIEKDEYGDIIFQVYSNIFYEKQEGVFEKLKHKLKLLYFVLSGKEYSLFEIVINEEQSNKFISDLKKFIEECEVEDNESNRAN